MRLFVELGALLTSLRSDLVAHFAREERGGYLAEVVNERPELETQVTVLLDEHAQIRDELDELVTVVVTEPNADLIARVVRLLDTLDSHEQRETTLWQKATLTDLGG
jgi:hypothetical protein